MTTPHAPSNRPSFLTLTAATIAGPLYQVVVVLIGVLLGVLGVLKFIPPEQVEVPVGGATNSPAVDLFALATGGVITTPWGPYLIGALQVVLGLGLLIPLARPLAGLGCLIAAVMVLIGFGMHFSTLTDGKGLNQAGVALIMLVVVLCAGAALGTRAAARRLGVSA
jgi:uncharacterized membrane protein YkgB